MNKFKVGDRVMSMLTGAHGVIISFSDIADIYTIDFGSGVSVYTRNFDRGIAEAQFILDPYITNSTINSMGNIYIRSGSSTLQGLDPSDFFVDDALAYGNNVVGCKHQWVPYNGFSESYTFCEKCNIKKDNQ